MVGTARLALANEKMTPERPLLRYFGGKWRLAPWIISQFPPHKIYVESFGGAASVLLRKPRSYAEIYNDLDGDVVNLFRVLQDRRYCDEFERMIRLTPFSRDEFNMAYEQTFDSIERARRLVIRAFMGFGSDGHNAEAGKTGFRSNSNRSGTTPAHDWASWPDQIKYFRARLFGVVIENRDAMEVMQQQDSPETLHFVDPPYLMDTRGASKHGYVHEMNEAQHESLIKFLPSLSGMVLLCGYKNDLYQKLGWHKVDRETHADGARDRIETIWMNPVCRDAQNQMNLFS